MMQEETNYNLRNELDFVREASNAARASNNLRAYKDVYIPKTLPVRSLQPFVIKSLTHIGTDHNTYINYGIYTWYKDQ
jgi:hypothetical protein